MSLDTADLSRRIRTGLSMSLDERQDRWLRIKQWANKDGKSLSEIQDLEERVSGQRLTRERIRKILIKAKPGTVPRTGPRLRTLQRRRTKLTEALTWWTPKDTENSRRRVEELSSELADVKAELRRLSR